MTAGNDDPIMEIFIQGEWKYVFLPEPLCYYDLQGTIHNGNLYLYDCRKSCDYIYCCKIESLLNCARPESDSEDVQDHSELEDETIWKANEYLSTLLRGCYLSPALASLL